MECGFDVKIASPHEKSLDVQVVIFVKSVQRAVALDKLLDACLQPCSAVVTDIKE